MNVAVQFAWQGIVPTGLAVLSGYFTKLNTNDLSAEAKEKLAELKNKPKSNSILSKHVVQKFFLGPVYQQVLDISGCNNLSGNKIPKYHEVVNVGRMDLVSFNKAMWQAYNHLCRGDFRSARRCVWSYMGTDGSRDDAINYLFSVFKSAEYNDYNIAIKYERDSLWVKLSKQKKLEIAGNKELRDAMNLELMLRHEMLCKLRQELGLDNLNYKGLDAYLFSLMNLNVEQKFKTLLSLKLDDSLWPAFYNKNGVLKSFNKVSFFDFPNGLTKPQFSLYLKRLNELIFYNQDCKNNVLFKKSAHAIVLGVKGNIYYRHLIYSSVSPTNIEDFSAEVDLIRTFLQEQKGKQKLPKKVNDGEENQPDPNDEKHIKEVSAFLAVTQKKSEELIEILNEKLAVLGQEFSIRSMNIYHTFHGNLRGNKPTGMHLLWRRCCFEVEKLKDWGQGMHSTCNVIKGGFVKPNSSLFPDSWLPDKVMDKLIEWSISGNISVLDKGKNIKIVRLVKNCCNDTIYFRSKVKNGLCDIDSVYPFIGQLLKGYDIISSCKCMR